MAGGMCGGKKEILGFAALRAAKPKISLSLHCPDIGPLHYFVN